LGTIILIQFLKYNRYNKKPQLRYFWTNPYNRTINWAEQPPSKKSGNARTAYFSAIQWKDAPKTKQNYPPNESDSIFIAIKSRILKLTPISWEIHHNWVDGIIFLLKRSNVKPLHEQFKMISEFQQDSDTESVDEETPKEDRLKVNSLNVEKESPMHRRVHTIVSQSPSTSNSLLTATPSKTDRKIKVISPSTKLSDAHSVMKREPGIFDTFLSTPRKLSRKFTPSSIK
jgi:hypothetical protein